MYYLYKITNKINNKIYIGQSINIKKRWSQHKRFANNPNKSKQYIHYSLAKYGIDNFIFEIIATCRTQDDANETESQLIIQYKSMCQEFGYNLRNSKAYGGHSEQTKNKLREATINQIANKGHPALGTKRTPDQIENLILARKNNPVEYTDEIRKKMSESHLGKKQSEDLIKKRIENAQKTRDEKRQIAIDNGIWKCFAPECDVIGKAEYRIVDGIRYCCKHALRLLNHGTLDKLPPHKCFGQEPHNRTKFTKEQIEIIMNDTRAYHLIGKDFGVSEKVISRVKRENKQNTN